MDDWISRKAALDAIDGIKPMQGNMEQLAIKALCWAAVKIIQPVDAAPVVHGRWIKPVPGDGEAYCSNCKHDALPCGYYMNPALMRYYETAYCPYCGAEMDGERRDSE